MVPEGWFEGRVSDLVSALEAGVSVNGENRPRKPYEKAVLKVSAVSYGYFDKNACKVISNEELKRARINPKAGQIIISRSNTGELVGASAFIEKNYDYLFLPDKLWQIVPKSHSDMRWLSYILSSEKLRHALSHLATGTSGSMKNITKSELLSLKIFIPPLPEQKKIARILSTWDKAIETVERLIENSKTQKKALMQQLLTGKQRLPGFEEKWEKTYLEDMTNITMGSSPNSDFYNDVGNGLPLIQGNADIKDRKSAPRIHTSKITKTCSKGDILLSVRAPVGAVAISMHDACIGRGIASISEKNKLPLSFVYQLLIAFESKWVQLSQGSTFDAVNSKDIKKLKIAIPLSKKEQQRIAVVLSTADKETKTLQQKLNCLKQEKNALMQQLLTGKRRVKVNVDG